MIYKVKNVINHISENAEEVAFRNQRIEVDKLSIEIQEIGSDSRAQVIKAGIIQTLQVLQQAKDGMNPANAAALN